MENEKIETVIVTKSNYERLKEKADFLRCLEMCGVDNWEGYGIAKEMMEEEE